MPKEYNDKSVIDSTFFCGYDDSGNLFASAWDRSADPILVTLPRKVGLRSDTSRFMRTTPIPPACSGTGSTSRYGAKGRGQDLPHQRLDRRNRRHDRSERRNEHRAVLDPRHDAYRSQLERQRYRSILALPGGRLAYQNSLNVHGAVRRDGQPREETLSTAQLRGAQPNVLLGPLFELIGDRRYDRVRLIGQEQPVYFVVNRRIAARRLASSFGST